MGGDTTFDSIKKTPQESYLFVSLVHGHGLCIVIPGFAVDNKTLTAFSWTTPDDL